MLDKAQDSERKYTSLKEGFYLPLFRFCDRLEGKFHSFDAPSGEGALVLLLLLYGEWP